MLECFSPIPNQLHSLHPNCVGPLQLAVQTADGTLAGSPPSGYNSLIHVPGVYLVPVGAPGPQLHHNAATLTSFSNAAAQAGERGAAPAVDHLVASDRARRKPMPHTFP
jgi:hypothetical protein